MIKSILILFFFGSNLFSQNTDTRISGKITGENNKPLSGANIVIEGSIDGTTCDSLGFYEFETSKTGKQTLLFTAIEYSEKRIEVNIESGKALEVNIKLSKSEVTTEEIIVTASSYTSGQQSQVTITPLEIVRIPGSDGDIFRAITTFPGSNQVDEGSRITVRGGNENEVLTLLDQASLYHPFIFDDAFNSSSYSTINPWGLRGINFSSGGFSAKFGNILSGVLDLKSYDLPQGTGMFAWLGLANASLSGVYLSPDKKMGATFDAWQTILEPYFKVNGFLTEQYNPIPFSKGIGGTVSYKLSEKGTLKYYLDYSGDKIGIRNTGPSFDGFFNTKSNTYFSNLKYSQGIGSSTLINTSISYSFHDMSIKYGVIDNKADEVYGNIGVDANHQLSSKIDFNYGAEYEYHEDKFNGTIPLYDYNVGKNAPSLLVSDKNKTGRIGAYAETQIKFLKKFFTVTGLRTDYHTLSRKFNFDPRLSMGYKFAKDNIIRGAIGLYHQFPDLRYYSQSVSNNLKPEQAVHYILGYELDKNDGLFMFRLEAYYKDYKNLVLYDKNSFMYYSGGTGYARGIDVFLRSRVYNKYSTWISYSYTDSKRKQYSVDVLAPAAFDITHNLTFVGSYNITDELVTGITYRISTGKPYTPVTGSYFDTAQNVYVPVYAAPNSSRFPVYHRLDVNLQYIFSLFGRFAVAVAQINNVLNNKNLYDYTYNYDYSKKIEILTTNKRQVYFGIGVQF